jgi:hypothetical protein
MSTFLSTYINLGRKTKAISAGFGQRALGLLLLVFPAGCATRVEYFTDDAYPPRLSATEVEWPENETPRPHIASWLASLSAVPTSAQTRCAGTSWRGPTRWSGWITRTCENSTTLRSARLHVR